mgnify:CR=1 FL=1
MIFLFFSLSFSLSCKLFCSAVMLCALARSFLCSSCLLVFLVSLFIVLLMLILHHFRHPFVPILCNSAICSSRFFRPASPHLFPLTHARTLHSQPQPQTVLQASQPQTSPQSRCHALSHSTALSRISDYRVVCQTWQSGSGRGHRCVALYERVLAGLLFIRSRFLTN